ncbi:methyl-accepting chemotaxis protein [Geobacter sp. SVR]|uniref:methyl-accepting chemotaxis protein n=1 Tax=Geobacter sp. SVR TaxID=2495594 RepID=UPI00143EF5BC|nr:methyl-accepting chemotaxis protein [Geobacter sp. SVR]BCS52693.1 hypothetical protein GSVR_10010 [Geobacter sp. SVR]GCF86811.1 hypothetical protein GSbR_34110 [Geobacter sp. SVR]
MNLRTKVNVSVAVLFTFAIVALITAAAISSRNSISDLLKNSQTALAKGNAVNINAWVLGKQAMIQAGASDLSKRSGQPREYITSQIKILSAAGGFQTVYPGYENGLFISSDGWIPDAGWDHRKRPWYEKARTEMKVTQTEPYVDAQTGKMIISFCAPITEGGTFSGVLSSDIPLDSVVKQVLDIRIGTSGYAFIMDKEGKILIHPDKDLVLKKTFQEVTGVSDLATRLKTTSSGSLEYTIKGVDKIMSYSQIPSTGWYLSATVDKKEIFAPVVKQTRTLVALGVLFLVAGLLVIILFVRKLLAPLSSFCTRVADIAEGEGDLTRRLDGGNRNDEIGILAGKLNQFIENVHSIIAKISSTSQTLAGEAEKLNTTASGISVGAEEVASQTVTVATSSEEMSATASDIANNCHLAADSARSVAASTQAGFAVVTNTVNGIRQRGEQTRQNARAISSLGERSEQIGVIVGTIEDIADQTNLLALNAAIEAARAGEQGRGFAVVADEVRALAERTTKATKEISDMIRAIQQETRSAIISMEEGVEETEKGVEEAAQIEGSLRSILEQVDSVTSQVSQIATAAEEQTATTGEITSNIQRVTSVIQDTARGAHETAATAQQLSALARDLQNIVGNFKL